MSLTHLHTLLTSNTLSNSSLQFFSKCFPQHRTIISGALRTPKILTSMTRSRISLLSHNRVLSSPHLPGHSATLPQTNHSFSLLEVGLSSILTPNKAILMLSMLPCTPYLIASQSRTPFSSRRCKHHTNTHNLPQTILFLCTLAGSCLLQPHCYVNQIFVVHGCGLSEVPRCSAACWIKIPILAMLLTARKNSSERGYLITGSIWR